MDRQTAQRIQDIVRALHRRRSGPVAAVRGRGEVEAARRRKNFEFQPSVRSRLPKGNGFYENTLQEHRQLHNYYEPKVLKDALGYKPEPIPDNDFFRRSEKRRGKHRPK